MSDRVEPRRVDFVTSSYCSGGSCVEFGRMPDGTVLIRDTKDRARQPLVFSPGEWRDFVAGVKAGEFDVS